ncbi:sialate O-acetylesterase [Sorangium sp. So ce233]|uniref:sialate O-acetylesterase n=1 Tax=Sorangium sp. So ce233 TaxID=3133290 RepID=UPI003F60F87A
MNMKSARLSLVLSLFLCGLGCSDGSGDGPASTGGGGGAGGGAQSSSAGPTGGDATSSSSGSGTGGASTTSGTGGDGGGTTSVSSGTGGAGGATGSGTGGAPAEDDNMVFLLIGQSNMEGVPKPEAQDKVENPRVKVLAYDNCTNLGRTYNEWYTASPPLHVCNGGVGPGDYFAKTLAEAYPTATIWLVPNAIAGVDIDFFRKGVRSSRRGEFRIPPDNHWNGAYEWVIERARLGQEKGPIRGIIFHQGESDSGQAVWLDKVSGMVSDLRADLGLGEVPFIAGELLYSGCCSGHNTIVNQIPSRIPNSFVISANGLAAMDQYHFNLAAQRTFGQRYGEKMIEALGD